MQFQRLETNSVSTTLSIRLSTGLLCFLLGLSSLAISQPKATPAKSNAPSGKTSAASPVMTVFNQMVAAAQKKDDKALVKFQAANATYIDGSGINRGFANFQKKAAAKVGVNASHAELTDFKVADVTERTVGDVAWVTYRYSLTGPVNGKPTPIVGVATIIFQRFGKDWKVVHSQTAGRPRTAADKAF